MELCAASLRHLPVGHVPHEDVLERVLLLVGDARLPQVRDEVAVLEHRQAGARIFRRRPLGRAEMCDRAGPEDRTDHRRVMGEQLLLWLQPVEARADQPLHVRRDRDVAHLVPLPALEVEQPLVAQHLHRLLEEERVAACVGDQRLGERRLGEGGVAGEIGQEGGGRLGAERLKVDRAAPALGAEEAGRVVGELRPRRADQRERRFVLRRRGCTRAARAASARPSAGPRPRSPSASRLARSCSARRMPQCSSACEISLVTYVPRGVVGMPIRFESADAIGAQLVEVIGGERLEERVELRRASSHGRRSAGFRPLT